MKRLREWLEETHSSGFELRRHFFLRFFDSDLVSTPGQWQVVAGGALAVLLSLSLILAQAYYHKYGILRRLDSPEPLQLAMRGDILTLITLAMFLIGLFTTLQWPSLFPGLRDYLALASLPARMRDVFVAKFAALVAVAAIFVVAVTAMPSVVFPLVMAGRHAPNMLLQVPAIFVSSSAGALFVFFSLVAAQGVLLNVLPSRQFSRITLAIQGLLLVTLLCGLPLALSASGTAVSIKQPPDWIYSAPPFWFLGLDLVMVGNRDPLAARLAWTAMAGLAGSAAAAVLTYLWSYRRHRVRVLESPAASSDRTRRDWGRAAELMIRDPRKLAVFSFVWKTLARSRQHRLALTAFSAIAIAVIFESFVSVALSGRRGLLSQAAISAPLALSMFVLAGLRYLFRLPVELRANWVFRVNEPGNRRAFLAGVERFLLYCAVIPVWLITLPLEIGVLGWGAGMAAGILCLAPSLILMELLLIRFEKIPFTSSYLPGQRPVIQTLVTYGVGLTLYVSMLGGLVRTSLQTRQSGLLLFAAMAAAWWKARSARVDDWEFGSLEFEELPEPAVLQLGLERD